MKQVRYSHTVNNRGLKREQKSFTDVMKSVGECLLTELNLLNTNNKNQMEEKFCVDKQTEM